MKAKIYSTAWCGWCDSAKSLLEDLGIPYEEVLLNSDLAIAEFKINCPGLTSVPQIFLDEEHIGGYKELLIAVGGKSVEENSTS